MLPFANMSGDAEQEYFSDGITEDIITDLSKVSALAVIARNSAFMFKGKNVDVPHVARELNVGHVLEGSVRKAGGRVRITAQLIDAASNDHVWAERYDRDLNDIFALQDEISQAIVKALKLKLLPEEKKAIEQRGTDSVEAYDLYLMARQLYVSGHEGDTRPGGSDHPPVQPGHGNRPGLCTRVGPPGPRTNDPALHPGRQHMTVDCPPPSGHSRWTHRSRKPMPSRPGSWPKTVATMRRQRNSRSPCAWTRSPMRSTAPSLS